MNYWEATLDGAAARAKKTPRWSCCQCTQDKEDSTRELLPGGDSMLLDGSRGGQGEPTGGAEPEEDATSLAVSQIHFALAPCDALRDG
jgi:hypothetical protein